MHLISRMVGEPTDTAKMTRLGYMVNHDGPFAAAIGMRVFKSVNWTVCIENSGDICPCTVCACSRGIAFTVWLQLLDGCFSSEASAKHFWAVIQQCYNILWEH